MSKCLKAADSGHYCRRESNPERATFHEIPYDFKRINGLKVLGKVRKETLCFISVYGHMILENLIIPLRIKSQISVYWKVSLASSFEGLRRHGGGQRTRHRPRDKQTQRSVSPSQQAWHSSYNSDVQKRGVESSGYATRGEWTFARFDFCQQCAIFCESPCCYAPSQ